MTMTPRMTTLALDPRSTAAQVHAWLAQDLTEAALCDGLAVLAVDPNWRLRQTLGPTTWDLALCYTPEGPWQRVCLQRHAADAAIWRCVLSFP